MNGFGVHLGARDFGGVDRVAAAPGRTEITFGSGTEFYRIPLGASPTSAPSGTTIQDWANGLEDPRTRGWDSARRVGHHGADTARNYWYHTPPSNVYDAGTIVDSVPVRDWRESINAARDTYSRSGGPTQGPLSLPEVRSILDQARTFMVYESPPIWSEYTRGLRDVGINVNRFGIGKDTAFLGHADQPNRSILINPYIQSPSLKRATQLHEMEHVVKSLAGVSIDAPARKPPYPGFTWPAHVTEPDPSVHHVTSYSDSGRTIMRWEQGPPKTLWQRLRDWWEDL